MVPAILGITAAAILAVTACFCARRIHARNKKTNIDSALPFQPTRRPTAVRSPSGQQTHYLKKSPSPTATKPLPGTLLTPSESQCPPPSKYSEENEISPKMVNGTDTDQCDSETPNHDAENEYGKLGTLVFKLRYLTERNALVVSVIRCRGLPGKSSNNTAANELPAGVNGKTQNATDPYVKLQLLPEKQHKVKTRLVTYFLPVTSSSIKIDNIKNIENHQKKNSF